MKPRRREGREGRRKKEEGRRKKEEGRRKKEEEVKIMAVSLIFAVQ